MATATFRPQDATWGYGWPTSVQAALSEFVPADAIDRYPIRAANIGLTTAAQRVDISSDMAGLLGEVQGPRTAFEHSGPIIVPLGPDAFNLGLIAQNAGAIKDAVQLGADAAWQQQISPDETDTILTDRFVTALRDLRDGNPVIYNPVGISGVTWNMEQGALVMMEYTAMPLYKRYYDLGVSVAGTPTQQMILRGLLNSTTNTLADRKLFVQVSAYADPAATVLAEFAVTPAGAVSFAVTAGLDAEGRPNWASVVDASGLPAGVRIGSSDVEVEVALPDNADVTVLDEVSWDNPIPDPTVVRPTTPTFTVSSMCITVGGVKIADLGSSTLVLVNDLTVNPGGACSAMPGSFVREGTSTAALTFDRRFVTFRLEKELLDDTPFAILIEGSTDVLVDGAGANGDVFDFELSLPICQFESGQSFKTLTSATDTTSTYVVRASPATGVAQWTLKMKTEFQTFDA